MCVSWDDRNQRQNCAEYTNPRPKNALQLVAVHGQKLWNLQRSDNAPYHITISAGVGWFRRAVRYSLGSPRSLLRMAVLTTSLCLVLLLTAGLRHQVSANDDSVIAPNEEGPTKSVDGASTSSSNLPTTGSSSDNAEDLTTDSPESSNNTTQSPESVTTGDTASSSTTSEVPTSSDVTTDTEPTTQPTTGGDTEQPTDTTAPTTETTTQPPSTTGDTTQPPDTTPPTTPPTTTPPTTPPTTHSSPTTQPTTPTDETTPPMTPTSDVATTDTPTTEVVEPTYPPGEMERYVSLSIFFILVLLGVSTILVHLQIRFKLRFMPESIAFLLIGFFVGLILFIVNKINPEVELQYQERFDPNPFFLLLLPPIIFESGYSLHKGNFFKNIGSIVIFAVLGTAISAIIVGGGLFALSKLGVVYQLNFIQSFTFGALISAVDPVATLALFHALDVNPTLNMLVFGESVLNDAVSIVMTKTIMEQASSSIDSPGLIFLNAIAKFLIMFCGSALLGIVSGLASALFLKFVNLREINSLEFVIWFIFGFGPYFMAEGLKLSGIMAVLFSGIVMSHYTHFNLSPVTQVTVQQTMRTVAFMAETVVFLYIGMQVFTITTSFSIGLIIWSLILILLGRAANIYPLSYVVNRFRTVKISPRMQFVMWFSGLRGAIAYALALNLQESVDDFASAETIRVLDTATLIIVLFTIVCLGSSTLPLLKFLSKGSAVDEVTLSKTEDQGAAVTYPEELEEHIASHPPVSSRHQWFLYLDYKYFRPFLIRRFTKQEVHHARIDMQRRTNEWYQGLREASSEDDDEDIIVHLETSFSHHQKSPHAGRGASQLRPPLGPSVRDKCSPPLVHVERAHSSRSSTSNSSNSEPGSSGSVRGRTSSRSPPSVDGGTVLSSSS